MVNCKICEVPIPPDRKKYCSSKCNRLARNEQTRRVSNQKPVVKKTCSLCHVTKALKHWKGSVCGWCFTQTSPQFLQYQKQNREASKRYREADRFRRNEINNSWRRKNPARVKEIRRRAKAKRKLNFQNVLNHRISSRIWGCLKFNKTRTKWEVLVGYSIQELRQHIEKQFSEGMTWEAYRKGEIQIDHILPVSLFSFTSPEDTEFKKCWALSNLRPLWKKDNLSKNDAVYIEGKKYLARNLKKAPAL